MSGEIKGWRVIKAEWTEKSRKLGTPKWKAISRTFTVKSSADEYFKMATKGGDEADYMVETVYLVVRTPAA